MMWFCSLGVNSNNNCSNFKDIIKGNKIKGESGEW
jgi:hypothetical protein